MRVKICGATRTGEVELLAAAGVDFVGLWHGVPGGRTELSLPNLTRLAAACDRIRPILVTLESTVDTLTRAVESSGIEWVQLHGYQQPGVVRALKALGATVVKVLHIRNGECVERPLIKAYQRAGWTCSCSTRSRRTAGSAVPHRPSTRARPSGSPRRASGRSCSPGGSRRATPRAIGR